MRRTVIVFSIAALTAVSTACGSDGPSRSEGSYCAYVGDHRDELASPSITDQAGIDRTLQLYRDVTARAPLAVEAEWTTMLDAVQTASSVDPNDQASAQRAADTARRSSQAATRIVTYTQQICGITIGQAPITTVAPTTVTPTT